MSKRLKPRGKPYVEGFPALRSLDVEQQMRRGLSVCEWWNEDSLPLGHIRILALTEHKLEFLQIFNSAPNIVAQQNFVKIDVACSIRVEHHARPHFACGRYGKFVEVIVIARASWACRTCHDLTYVSRRLTGYTRLLRRRDELKRRIAVGRRRYERTAKLEADRAEHDRILGELGSAWDEMLPTELAHAVSHRWLHSVEEVTAGNPRDPRYRWRPGQGGGFELLEWEGSRGLPDWFFPYGLLPTDSDHPLGHEMRSLPALKRGVHTRSDR